MSVSGNHWRRPRRKRLFVVGRRGVSLLRTMLRPGAGDFADQLDRRSRAVLFSFFEVAFRAPHLVRDMREAQHRSMARLRGRLTS